METFDRILSPVSPFIAIAGLIYMGRAMVADIERSKRDRLRWLILPALAVWWFAATAIYRASKY